MTFIGAKYFVLTSKHHDGFAMWDTARAFGWNSMVGLMLQNFKFGRLTNS
jgi:Alpha-L-fucosidase